MKTYDLQTVGRLRTLESSLTVWKSATNIWKRLGIVGSLSQKRVGKSWYISLFNVGSETKTFGNSCSFCYHKPDFLLSSFPRSSHMQVAVSLKVRFARQKLGIGGEGVVCTSRC